MRRCAAFLVFLAVLLARPAPFSPALHPHREPERVAARHEAPEYRELVMWATAYTHTGNRTASGMWPEVGTVAVDPEVIPLGTRLWVEGYGWGVAADTGRLIQGRRIDVFLPSRAECLDWGRKRVRVRVYERSE